MDNKNMKQNKEERKDSFRGITDEFASNVRNHPVFQEFFLKHKDKVIVGIRDNYVNLYYNCDSIAKFSDTGGPARAKIAPYYLDSDKKSSLITIDPKSRDLSDSFETIIQRSDDRKKREKQSQERLYIANNQNSSSNWFCIDVEYTRSVAGKEKAEPWRFDLIAVSKNAPYRVALIELKYSFGAIGGSSGITKHIHDFYEFHTNGSYRILLPELISIIKGLRLLGVDIPESIKEDLTVDDFCQKPEYYFITLDNNPDENGNTPKMSMAGYLFGDKTWGSRKASTLVSKNGFRAVVKDNSFRPSFKFSKATLPDLGIDNIIDSSLYEEGEY